MSALDFDPSISRSVADEEKAIALEVLNAIKSPAIIAGGAPRNWYLGSKAKDIDIYIAQGPIPFYEEPYWSGMPSPINKGGTTIMVPRSTHNPDDGLQMVLATVDPGESGSQKGIKSVDEFEYKGLLFQIITVNKEETGDLTLGPFNMTYSEALLRSYINASFDFGINKISIDRTGRTYCEMDFGPDIRNKTLTLRIANAMRYNGHCLAKRFEKMKQYFPDHQVVIR